MHDTIEQCERTAHTHGLVAGLELALAGIDVASAPGRVAALPSTRVASGSTVLPHRMAAHEGVSFVRITGPNVPMPNGVTAALAAARIGTSQRLLEWAVAHLSDRLSGGEPLIRKQLILGSVADLHTALEAARRAVRVSWRVPGAMTDVHDRLTVLDWDTAGLIGASGYVVGSPTWGTYVSRLIANCWIAREAAPCRD